MNPEVLSSKRKELGLTQQQVAERAGMIQQAYARLESGDRTNPTFETAERIADALGVSLDEMREKPKAKKRKQTKGR